MIQMVYGRSWSEVIVAPSVIEDSQKWVARNVVVWFQTLDYFSISLKHFFHARDADVVIIAFEVRVSSAAETDVPGISHLIRTPSTVVATVAMRISHFRNIGWLAVLACVLDCNSVPFTHQKYRVLLIGKVVTFLSGFGFNAGSTTEPIAFFPPEPVIGEV